MITEALLTERVRRKATPIEPASEEMKLRTQIYAANFGDQFTRLDIRIRIPKRTSRKK